MQRIIGSRLDTAWNNLGDPPTEHFTFYKSLFPQNCFRIEFTQANIKVRKDNWSDRVDLLSYWNLHLTDKHLSTLSLLFTLRFIFQSIYLLHRWRDLNTLQQRLPLCAFHSSWSHTSELKTFKVYISFSETKIEESGSKIKHVASSFLWPEISMQDHTQKMWLFLMVE